MVSDEGERRPAAAPRRTRASASRGIRAHAVEQQHDRAQQRVQHERPRRNGARTPRRGRRQSRRLRTEQNDSSHIDAKTTDSGNGQ